MSAKRGLGRGLDALLGDQEAEGEEASAQGVRTIPVDMIRPGPYQPRKRMDEEALQELAESIRSQGIVQPVVVRERPEDGEYELIAGERRWRAAQKAGLEDVPALIRSLENAQALEVALIENIQREELTPLEEARAFERLTREFELTHEAMAERVGRNRATISNTLRLLRLPESVQQAVEEGELRMGHARALLGLEGNERLGEAAAEVIRKGMSVRGTEELVRRFQKETPEEEGEPPPRSHPARKDPDVERLEQDLAERLGAKVQITQRNDRGRLVIEYASLDELEGIVQRIG